MFCKDCIKFEVNIEDSNFGYCKLLNQQVESYDICINIKLK